MSRQSEFCKNHPDVHPQACEFFPDFNYRVCNGDRNIICRMDSGANNKVGHQQRAFSVWHALETCGPMDLGLDLGSSKGMTPYCVHVDLFGDGREHPFYGGVYQADVVWDAAKAHEVFPANTFPFISSNHSLEHMKVGGDAGIVDVLSGWLRLLRPGGVLAMIIPDNGWFDVMGCDKDHSHAWSAAERPGPGRPVADFRPRILDPLLARGGVQLVDYNTLDNHFSFDVVLRKG